MHKTVLPNCRQILLMTQASKRSSCRVKLAF